MTWEDRLTCPLDIALEREVGDVGDAGEPVETLLLERGERGDSGGEAAWSRSCAAPPAWVPSSSSSASLGGSSRAVVRKGVRSVAYCAVAAAAVSRVCTQPKKQF